VWRTLHLMALVYPDEPNEGRQKSMLDYLLNMCPNLPCGGCSIHCNAYMGAHPPQVQSKTALRHYLVDFHNDVNKRTGKRELSYEEADQILHSTALDFEDWRRLDRASKMRREDSGIIHRWKDAYNELHSQKKATSTWTIIVLILLVALLVLVLSFTVPISRTRARVTQ